MNKHKLLYQLINKQNIDKFIENDKNKKFDFFKNILESQNDLKLVVYFKDLCLIPILSDKSSVNTFCLFDVLDAI